MRLIDADKIQYAKDWVVTDKTPEVGGFNAKAIYRVTKEEIDAMPTVDAVPVVHGRWVHHPEIGWGSTCLCSECGEKTVETVMGEPRYKFCPMCGADMRKNVNNEKTD